MAKRKRTKPKAYSKSKQPYKRKSKYSLNEKRAYWMGVGASVAVHDNFFDFVDKTSNSKISNSLKSGYLADTNKDVSKKIRI